MIDPDIRQAIFELAGLRLHREPDDTQIEDPASEARPIARLGSEKPVVRQGDTRSDTDPPELPDGSVA
jgi:hypothetical protein